VLRGDDLSVAPGRAPRSGAGAEIRMTAHHEGTNRTKDTKNFLYKGFLRESLCSSCFRDEL
jgi:hypothetical protein